MTKNPVEPPVQREAEKKPMKTERLPLALADGSVDGVIATIQAALAAVPEAYRASARIEFDAHEEYGACRQDHALVWSRPFTPEEQARLAERERKMRENQVTYHEAQIARLKSGAGR